MHDLPWLPGFSCNGSAGSHVAKPAAGGKKRATDLTLGGHSFASPGGLQVILQSILGLALPNLHPAHKPILPVVTTEHRAEACVVPGKGYMGEQFKHIAKA